MNVQSTEYNRRHFIRTSVSLATGIALVPSTTFPQNSLQDNIHLIGPKEGFSPHIGTLLSMMTWMRNVVLLSVGRISKEDLDYLHDARSNTIGAMLLHLAATERIYQGMTMNIDTDYKQLGNVNWDAAMHLGDEGRRTIKGNSLDFYTTALSVVRERTVKEMRNRDDKWLMEIDPSGFQNQPTNNYCKWFHVCEHESNHNGQIKWIKGRLTGSKDSND